MGNTLPFLLLISLYEVKLIKRIYHTSSRFFRDALRWVISPERAFTIGLCLLAINVVLQFFLWYASCLCRCIFSPYLAFLPSDTFRVLSAQDSGAYLSYMLAAGGAFFATLAVVLVFLIQQRTSLRGRKLINLLIGYFTRKGNALVLAVGLLILWAAISYLFLVLFDWAVLYSWGLSFSIINLLFIIIFTAIVAGHIISFARSTLKSVADPDKEIKKLAESYVKTNNKERAKGFIQSLVKDIRYYIAGDSDYEQVKFHMRLLEDFIIQCPEYFNEPSFRQENLLIQLHYAFRDLEKRGKIYDWHENVYFSYLLGLYEILGGLKNEIERDGEKKEVLLIALDSTLMCLVSSYEIYRKNLPKLSLTGDLKNIIWWMLEGFTKEGREVYEKNIIAFMGRACYHEDFYVLSNTIMRVILNDRSAATRKEWMFSIHFLFYPLYGMVYIATPKEPTEDENEKMRQLFSWMDERVDRFERSIHKFEGLFLNSIVELLVDSNAIFFDVQRVCYANFFLKKESENNSDNPSNSRTIVSSGPSYNNYVMTLIVYLKFLSDNRVSWDLYISYVRNSIGEKLETRSVSEARSMFEGMKQTLDDIINKGESWWNKWGTWVGVNKGDAETFQNKLVTPCVELSKEKQFEALRKRELDKEKIQRLINERWNYTKKWFESMRKRTNKEDEPYTRIEFTGEDKSLPQEEGLYSIPKRWFIIEEDPSAMLGPADKNMIEGAIKHFYMNKFLRLLPEDSRPEELPGEFYRFVVTVMETEYMKGKKMRITLGKEPPDFETQDDSKEEHSASDPTFTLTLKAQMKMEVEEKNTPKQSQKG